MAWSRDMSQPSVYNGQAFRSVLEANVAMELTRMGVEWGYEIPAHKAMAIIGPSWKPDPPPVYYLPDFTILRAPTWRMDPPSFLEVKPATLLHAVREYVGCEPGFTDDREYPVDWEGLRDAGLDEIWKPKRLAELYDVNVLVVSKINGVRTLSLLARPDRIVLSKQHPLVNHRAVTLREKREERDREYRIRQEEREREDAAEHAENGRALLRLAVDADRRSASFDDFCWYCGARKKAERLEIFRDPTIQGWAVICRAHLWESESEVDGSECGSS